MEIRDVSSYLIRHRKKCEIQKTDMQNVRNVTDMNTCIVWLVCCRRVFKIFFVCLFIFVYCVKEVWNVNVFCEIMNSCLRLIILAFLMRLLFFRSFSPCRVDKR